MSTREGRKLVLAGSYVRLDRAKRREAGGCNFCRRALDAETEEELETAWAVTLLRPSSRQQPRIFEVRCCDGCRRELGEELARVAERLQWPNPAAMADGRG